MKTFFFHITINITKENFLNIDKFIILKIKREKFFYKLFFRFLLYY
jgi:hypothetical protein